MNSWWGNFVAIGSRGSRYGLIGHDSMQVRAWLAAHPDFNGSIHFDYGNDEPDVDVTSEFIGDDMEAHFNELLSVKAPVLEGVV